MPTLEMSHKAKTKASTEISSPYHSDAEKHFYLITNVSATKASDSEIDLHAESWKLPYSIDDSELTFDGKPLNLLYEENRSMAEYHVNHEAREHKARGRTRSRPTQCPK